jgi:ABC-2 type transport system ATP-binding protein
VLLKSTKYYEIKWALKGVSLQVKKGESIGIVGRNGSGKTTLLKTMAGILCPNKGSIMMKGRVACLDLGAGFNRDMSGRENIYTNASVFGLSRKEIERRFDAILEFCELGEFINNPVRTYSSGMYSKLTFAIAINMDADILLIDEVLAVGDAGFRGKCADKLKEIKNRGTTLVIVSHGFGVIEELCERSYWLKDGLVEKFGVPSEVHRAYLDFIEGKGSNAEAHPVSKLEELVMSE